jgi:hypothetical protein
MTEQIFLQQYKQMPDNLKQELWEYFQFLVQKYQNKNVLDANSVQLKPKTKSKLNEIQKLLMNAPPLSDEDLFIIEQKRESIQTWKPSSLTHPS